VAAALITCSSSSNNNHNKLANRDTDRDRVVHKKRVEKQKQKTLQTLQTLQLFVAMELHSNIIVRPNDR